LNTFSHILIGKVLYEYLKEYHGIYLNKKSFIKGNYSPDFNTSAIKRPHYIKYNLNYLQQEINALANTKLKSAHIDKAYSKRLGIICHYCADFFCYTHSIHFKGSTKAHIKYERSLHKYFISRLKIIKSILFMLKKDINIDASIINFKINQYQSDYLDAKACYSNDLFYTFQVCVETVVLLIECSNNLSFYKKPVFYIYQEAIV
jgi:hypothetical protein